MSFALVALVVIVLAEAWYVWRPSDPTVSAEKPVVTSQVVANSGTDTAAKALKDIVSTSYTNYDDQTAAAAQLMTPAFAEKYRQTAEDVEQSIMSDKTEVQAEIVSQGVVTASADQVQALVFLNQSVTKDGDHLTVTPFRALVTVVRHGGGWLVSRIETT